MKSFMKKLTTLVTSFLVMTTLVGFSVSNDRKTVNAAGTPKTIEHTFAVDDFKKNGVSKFLISENTGNTNFEFSTSNTGGYVSGSYGDVQVGSNSYPAKSISIKSKSFTNYYISEIDIRVRGHATSVISMSINGKELESKKNLINSYSNIVFSNNDTNLIGDLSIDFVVQKKAVYFDSLSIIYTEATPSKTYTLNYYIFSNAEGVDEDTVTSETITEFNVNNLRTYYIDELFKGHKRNKYCDKWFTDLDCTIPVTNDIVLTDNIDIYGTWEDMYYICFINDDFTVFNEHEGYVLPEEKYPEFTDKPTKKGYYFEKWITDYPTEGTTFEFDKPLSNYVDKTNKEIYVRPSFKEKPLIRFMQGSEVLTSQSITPGDLVTIKEPTVKIDKETQIFRGWFYTDDAGKEVEFDFKTTKLKKSTDVIAKIVTKPTITIKDENGLDVTRQTVEIEMGTTKTLNVTVNNKEPNSQEQLVWNAHGLTDFFDIDDTNKESVKFTAKKNCVNRTASVSIKQYGETIKSEVTFTVPYDKSQTSILNSRYYLSLNYSETTSKGLAQVTSADQIISGNTYYIGVKDQGVLMNKTNSSKYFGYSDIDFNISIDENSLKENAWIIDINSDNTISLKIKNSDNSFKYLYSSSNGKDLYFEGASNAKNKNFKYDFGQDNKFNVYLVSGKSSGVQLAYNISSPRFKGYEATADLPAVELYQYGNINTKKINSVGVKFAFDISQEVINDAGITEIGIKYGLPNDEANMKYTKLVDLSVNKDGAARTYVIGINFNNSNLFTKELKIIPCYKKDGKEYNFIKKQSTAEYGYTFSVKSIVDRYLGTNPGFDEGYVLSPDNRSLLEELQKKCNNPQAK